MKRTGSWRRREPGLEGGENWEEREEGREDGRAGVGHGWLIGRIHPLVVEWVSLLQDRRSVRLWPSFRISFFQDTIKFKTTFDHGRIFRKVTYLESQDSKLFSNCFKGESHKILHFY